MRRFTGWVLIIMITVIAALAVYGIPRFMYPLRHEDLLIETARAYGLDPALVAAVIYCESRFQDGAISPKGALGLMQLMPATARWLCQSQGWPEMDEQALLQPAVNLALGCDMLSRMLTYYDSLPEALAAYNAGPGRVDGWLADQRYSQDGKTLALIPFEETRSYVGKVQSAYERYKRIYASLQDIAPAALAAGAGLCVRRL